MDDASIKDTCRLYIKLYCKRRGPYRYNLMEATQSWKSLDEHERELFKKKFEECRLKKRDKFVNFLSKTQPYFKKKTDKRSNENLIKQENTREKEEENTKSKETNNEVITNVEINNANQTTEIENSSSRMDDDSRLPNEIDIHEQTDCEIINPDHSNSAKNITRFIKEQQASLNNNFGQQYNGILTEPAPPTVLCGKELFESIQSANGNSTASWKSLTRKEKCRYGQAVTKLKKTYIRNYKAFLEGLPSKELFKYYNDYFN